MNFTDHCMITDLLEEFDLVLENYETHTEGEMGDLDAGNIIKQGLAKLNGPVGTIVGVISAVAKLTGKKSTDILKLFSQEGVAKVKEFIKNNILGSEEVKYMMHKFDKDRYKGYKGFEQFVKDMQEDNPKILDSLKMAVQKIVS